jgi:hypothetical protein
MDTRAELPRARARNGTCAYSTRTQAGECNAHRGNSSKTMGSMSMKHVMTDLAYGILF